MIEAANLRSRDAGKTRIGPEANRGMDRRLEVAEKMEMEERENDD